MRIALIGCGSIAQVHAGILRGMKDIELCAFSDIREDRALALAQGARVYTDYHEMLRLEKPDSAHICTPHHLHVPMAVDCLRAGCHVFMEKPAAINRRQLGELMGAYEGSGRRLGLCLQNRYNPNIAYVKEQLDRQAYGRMLGGMAYVAWQRDAAYYRGSDWRGSLDREGGGALINQSVHTLDLLQHLMGPVASVEASMANHHLQGVIEVEDTMEAYLRFADGQSASFYATNAYVRNAPVFIEIVCERGRYRIEETMVSETNGLGATAVKDFPPPNAAAGKDYWGAGHEACIRDFYGALAMNRPFMLSIEKARASIELMLACYESARQGRPVSLPSQP